MEKVRINDKFFGMASPAPELGGGNGAVNDGNLQPNVLQLSLEELHESGQIANGNDDGSTRDSASVWQSYCPGEELPNSESVEEVYDGDDGDHDYDSVLEAAALLEPLDGDESRSTISPLTARERLTLLVALLCALIILPTMLLPEILRKETRYPGCRTDEQCDVTATCVPDGLEGKGSICCPIGLTKTTWHDDGMSGSICGNLSVGARCDQMDNLCASGYCIRGKCAKRASRKFERCDKEYHCERPLTCQQRTYADPETVCCQGSSNGVCNEMPVGTPCDTMDRCKSRICVFDSCATSKLPNSEKCEKDQDCQGGSCAADAIGSNNKVCCRQAYPTEGFSLSGVCGDRPKKTFCDEMNESCASGYCINKYCESQPLESGNKCTENADCKSGGCGLVDADFSKSTVCCENAIVVRVYHENRYHGVCGNRPQSTFCSDSNDICFSGLCIKSCCANSRLGDFDTCIENQDCESGGCALSSTDQSASLICCPDGLTTTTTRGEKVCAGMPAGTPCDTDDTVCESGFCIEKTCAAEGLETNQPCQDGADCKSGACALRAANSSEGDVCCPSSTTVMGNAVSTSLDLEYRRLCAAQPNGTYCNEMNDMCESGLCIRHECASEKLHDLEVCIENFDCTNRTCSLAFAVSDAPKVCCAGGMSAQGVLTDTTWSVTVCGGLGAGSICSDIESACKSGYCINGTCSALGLPDIEECLDGDDCISGRCALKAANATETKICCSGTATAGGTVWGSSSYQTVCADRPDGTFCNEIDEMCSSGLCIDGYCANETLKDFSLCSEGTDCKNRVCALSSANATAPRICCPEGKTTSSYSYQYGNLSEFCGGMPDGTFCDETRTICESGFCIDKICGPVVEMFEPCKEFSDCFSGACVLVEASTQVSFNGSSVDMVCAGKAVGTCCGDLDSVCLSGFCINQSCIDEKRAELKPCMNVIDMPSALPSILPSDSPTGDPTEA